MLIDSHCHLDFDSLSGDLDGVLARAQANSVMGMVTISTRLKRFEQISAIAQAHANIWCTIGTHPHNADEELDISVDDIVKLSNNPKCIGIGEAGLDYHYDNAPRAAQAEGFRNHIAAARITGLPLVIHARSADEDMMAVLEEETGQGAFPFVLHCFSSGAALARKGLELGGYISFSGIVTFKNATEIQEVARFVPADRYLVETDAPYLAPIPYRGQNNEPGHVIETARKLAELRGITLEEVSAQTTANFFKLFTKAQLSK